MITFEAAFFSLILNSLVRLSTKKFARFQFFELATCVLDSPLNSQYLGGKRGALYKRSRTRKLVPQCSLEFALDDTCTTSRWMIPAPLPAPNTANLHCSRTYSLRRSQSVTKHGQVPRTGIIWREQRKHFVPPPGSFFHPPQLVVWVLVELLLSERL